MSVEQSVSERADGFLFTAVVALLAVGLLATSWYTAEFVSTAVFEVDASEGIATVLVVGVAATSFLLGQKSGSKSAIAGYLAAIGIVTTLFLGTVHIVVGFLLSLVIGSLAQQGTAVVTAGLAVGCLTLVCGFVMKAGRLSSWTLSLRMAVATLSLALALAAVFALLWPFTYLVFASVNQFVVADFSVVAIFSAVTTGLVMLGFGYVEYKQPEAIENRADAVRVSREEYPQLYSRTERIANHLDIPVPTIALSSSAVPETFVLGFRPSNTHLVVSQGTLDALSGEELDAVLAHELAHVANRDASVMTAVAAPHVVADSLSTRIGAQRLDWETGRDFRIAEVILLLLLAPLLVIFACFWLVWVLGVEIIWAATWIVVAFLSRTRELVADRAAVEVTGSPAALASALRTLDDQIGTTPTDDLRAVSSVSAFSVVPLDQGVVGSADGVKGLVARLGHALFGSHPSTERRIERLEALAKEYRK